MVGRVRGAQSRYVHRAVATEQRPRQDRLQRTGDFHGQGPDRLPPPSEPTTTTTPTSTPTTTTTTTTTTTPPPAPPVVLPAATFMQPFPVVRIAGSENATGVRVGLLTVQAPVGATVSVTCRGRDALSVHRTWSRRRGRARATSRPAWSDRASTVRALPAGRGGLEIRVSKPGQIGKYTRFAVRRGKLPTRADTCLSPLGIKPIACPSS